MTYENIVEIYYPKILPRSIALNVKPEIILSIIYQESRGNIFALGKSDYGLMQITKPALTDFNLETGKNYNMFDMFINPEKNIEVGCWYIAYLKKFFPDSEYKQILAYNYGIGNVRNNNYPDKENYADMIYLHIEFIKNILII